MYTKWLIYIHFSLWVYFVLFSIYSFTISTQKVFQDYTDLYDDFTGLSEIFHRKRDKSDFEWESINYYIQHYYPVITLTCLCTNFLQYARNFERKQIQIWHTTISMILILYNFGCITLAILLLQPVLFLSIFNHKSFVLKWITSLSCLALITVYKSSSINVNIIQLNALNEHDSYLIIMALFWMNLKCTSYVLDNEIQKNLLDFIFYCFYFPTLLSGPFICYTDFRNCYKILEKQSITKKCVILTRNLTKCLFYWLFGNICLHFCYLSAIGFHPEKVEQFDLWSIGGYGYVMGQFFHLKYIIWYGLSTLLANFDNIEVPYLPRCIGRVHLYTDMWKYFDSGLYKYLRKYIYLPVLTKVCNIKPLASLLCFIFVFLWHGIEWYIFIWAFLNYLGVCIEHVAQIIQTNCLEDTKINKRLLKSALASPLLLMSAISNFYFFAGFEIGNIFVSTLVNGDFCTNFVILFALYCCCEFSTEIRYVNSHKMN